MNIPPSFQRYTVNKSNEKAEEYQKLGNASFKNKEWMEAIIFYNKSICFANSKNILSLVYANRSAVYFEIQRYEECLENIEWARKNGYPKNKMSKLNKRERECKQLMIAANINKIQITGDSSDLFKLSYPANKKIPWIVDCLEVRTTPKDGRGIYAKRNLKAGDIISTEDPVVCILRDDGLYKHCYNCMKTCMLNLIPCARTASIMFCSAECMDKSYSKFGELGTMLMDDVKVFAEVMASFDGHQEFEDFVDKGGAEKMKSTLFDYNLSNPKDSEYNRNIISCLLALSTSKNQPINSDSCNIRKNLSKKATDRVLDILFMNNVTHTFCDHKSNYHNDSASIPLFASLINHSCMPNAFPIFVDNKIVVCVLEPIKAGSQILCSYINQSDPMREVLKKLMFSHYNFKCDCLACTDENYSNLWNVSAQINDLMKTEDCLNEGWDIINNKSNTSEEIVEHKVRNMLIIQLLAYDMTFPC